MRKFLFMSLLFLFSLNAFAEEKFTVITMPENVTVRGGTYSQNNLGDKRDLIVSTSTDPSNVQYAYLKADISEIKPDFQKAFIRLYPASGINGVIDVYSVGTDWAEKSLTFDTQPEEEGYITSFQVKAPFTDIEITSFVSGKLGTTDALAFKLKGSSSHYFSFSDTEYKKWPEMILIYEEASSYEPYVKLYSHYEGQVIHPVVNVHGALPIWVWATATDVEGEIAGVNMTCNGKDLGTKTDGYNMWIVRIVPGIYDFTVRAWDKEGNVSVDQVRIKVDNSYHLTPGSMANLRGGEYADSYLYANYYFLLRNSTNPDYHYESEVSFDLSSFSGNSYSATLRLWPMGGEGLGGTLSYSPSDSWTGRRLTFNAKPTDIEEVTSWVINGDVLDIDVTDLVNQEGNGDGMLTLFLKADNLHQFIKFYSYPRRPILIIEKNIKPPVAAEDHFSVSKNETLSIEITKLLANDYDPEGRPLSVTDCYSPRFGSLSGHPGRGYTYIPDRDFTGTDTFSYFVSDGYFTTQGTIRITVTP